MKACSRFYLEAMAASCGEQAQLGVDFCNSFNPSAYSVAEKNNNNNDKYICIFVGFIIISIAAQKCIHSSLYGENGDASRQLVINTWIHEYVSERCLQEANALCEPSGLALCHLHCRGVLFNCFWTRNECMSVWRDLRKGPTKPFWTKRVRERVLVMKSRSKWLYWRGWGGRGRPTITTISKIVWLMFTFTRAARYISEIRKMEIDNRRPVYDSVVYWISLPCLYCAGYALQICRLDPSIHCKTETLK